MQRLWRCTWRQCSSEFGDALGDREQTTVLMHLGAMIVRTWRLKSSDFGDTLGERDRGSLEMHLEAVMVRTWTP